MPKIYKQNCKECGKYYKGGGKYYCGYKCAGRKMSRLKIGKTPWNLGIPASEATKKKMSIFRMGNKYCVGRIPWNKDKKGVMPIPWNKGMKGLLLNPNFKTNNPAKSGKDNPNWKGGITINKKDYYSNKHKEWARKNPEKVRYYTNKRRVIKAQADGTHTLEEWENLKNLYGYMCLCCKKEEPEIKLTEDHIIPLSKGGSDFIENIQPLCMKCNSSKRVDITSYLPIPIQNFID